MLAFLFDLRPLCVLLIFLTCGSVGVLRHAEALGVLEAGAASHLLAEFRRACELPEVGSVRGHGLLVGVFLYKRLNLVHLVSEQRCRDGLVLSAAGIWVVEAGQGPARRFRLAGYQCAIAAYVFGSASSRLPLGLRPAGAALGLQVKLLLFVLLIGVLIHRAFPLLVIALLCAFLS